MKRWICLLLALLLCASVFAGCSCSHEYAPATCTAPATCILCQQTQGQPLGHTWQEATCEVPKTCTTCKLTDGVAPGHTWQEATCLSAAVCTSCGATQGEAAVHVEDLSQLDIINFVKATCEGTISCKNCGVQLSTGHQPLPRLHDGVQFLCSPHQFFERFQHILRVNTVLDASMTTDENGVYICQIQVNPQKTGESEFISQLVFLDGDRVVTDQDSVTAFDGIQVRLGTNVSFMEALFGTMAPTTIAAVLMACDPTALPVLSSEAETALFDAGSFCTGGLTYTLDVNEDNTLTLTAKITSDH